MAGKYIIVFTFICCEIGKSDNMTLNLKVLFLINHINDKLLSWKYRKGDIQFIEPFLKMVYIYEIRLLKSHIIFS